MENKKRNYKIIAISVAVALLIFFASLFYLYREYLVKPFIEMEGTIPAASTILMRAAILGAMSYYLLRRWFKQEVIYTSDAYFLFGTMFGIFAYAKLFDLFWNLIFIGKSFSEEFLLILLKIRYFIIIINALPILYLALESTLTLANLYKKKELDRKQFNSIKLRIIIVYTIIISIYIIIVPTYAMLSYSLPFITMIIFLCIAIMFFFMYKNKRLSQANGLLIGLAFVFFIISNAFRPILSWSLMTYGVMLAEIIDTGINFLMFIGFVTKPPYAKSKIK